VPDHPVDAMKEYFRSGGRELDPQAERELRAICDAPVQVWQGLRDDAHTRAFIRWCRRRGDSVAVVHRADGLVDVSVDDGSAPGFGR
jgi:hypothetical protein